MNTPKCNKCNVEMKLGVALKNGFSGIPDFVDDATVITVSPNSKKVEMISCWKCPKCGHSIQST